MNDGWQVVLNETAVEFLLGCRLKQREVLIKVLHELAMDPYQAGDFEARDSRGQPMQIKLCRAYLMTWWVDSAVKEVRVVRIESV